MALFSQHRDTPRAADYTLTADTAASLLTRYRPIETRATGGFGSVEVCMDTKLKRRVAIKRMPLNAQGGPSSSPHAALSEAQIASMLQHPNIVSVIDFTYDSAYAYLVMEYVEGMSLEEFLAKVDGNSLTYDETAAIADALGAALSFAHENGVLHLDIKPGNVLIDRKGHIKLTDFGMSTLSRAAGFGDAQGGTIGYMPPEQLDIETGKVDQRSDLFALAAVLYECLCGTAPFRAATPSDSLDKIIRRAPAPSTLLDGMPMSAQNALLDALSPMPQDRPNTVAAFCDEFLAELGNPREGQRSLAHMIDEISAQEEAEAEDIDAGDAPERGIPEFDPLLGLLGSRYENAPALCVGAVSGLSCAVLAYKFMGAVSSFANPGLAVAALVIGFAAGIAPQIGTALAIAGFAYTVASTTISAVGLVAVLAFLVLFCAIAVAWWFAWGRSPAASACVMLVLAAGLCTQNVLAFAGVAVAFAAATCAPSFAAASVGMGLVLTRLYIGASTSAYVFTSVNAWANLAQPLFLLCWAASILGAALGALGLALYRDRAQTGSSRAPLLIPAILCAIVAFLLYCGAEPMEISALEGPALAAAIGTALVSSIIFWIYVYLFGCQTEEPKGDRQ